MMLLALFSYLFISSYCCRNVAAYRFTCKCLYIHCTNILSSALYCENLCESHCNLRVEDSSAISTYYTCYECSSLYAEINVVKLHRLIYVLLKHWIAFYRCSRAIKRCMKICSSFRCNSYGPWTLTKCNSIHIFTLFYNKVCCDIAYFKHKYVISLRFQTYKK